MKKVFTVTLILMAILTVIYVSAVVYANSNYDSSYNDDFCDHVFYAAFEYKMDTPPSDWYMPEQLGIYNVIEYGENGSWLHITVDLEKAPFPLQSENPIFLYKDKFYQVSPLWTTPGLPESVKQWQIPIGEALGAEWVFTGALFVSARAKKWKRQ